MDAHFHKKLINYLQATFAYLHCFLNSIFTSEQNNAHLSAAPPTAAAKNCNTVL